ncbi:unnamed protein product, partial [Bubo scandiacus]
GRKSWALRWGFSGQAVVTPYSSHHLTERVLATVSSKLRKTEVLLQLGPRGIAWEEVVLWKA